MERVLLPREQKQDIDDLKQIRGIGPIMEQRLHQAGILTFAQLANMSTENLAELFSDMPGLSAERIAEKGWGMQAQLLMEKAVKIDHPVSEDQHHYSAVFSVDLLLDKQNRVRRTHILHVQSKKEDSWADWDQERLAGFIFKNATIRSTPKSNPIDETQTKPEELAGDLNISKVEIQTLSGKVTHWDINVNEPFAIRLILNMDKTSVAPGTPLQFQSQVYVKNLTDGKRHNVGEARGMAEASNLFPLTVHCQALPQGSYRLEACVVLSPDLENSNPRSRLMAMAEGRVFRVS